jgi:hypothetical protein
MQVRLFLFLSLALVWLQQVLASIDALLRSAFEDRENVGGLVSTQNLMHGTAEPWNIFLTMVQLL